MGIFIIYLEKKIEDSYVIFGFGLFLIVGTAQ